MINRTNQYVVEAAATKHFDTSQYTWHKYTSERGTKLEGARGRTVTLRKGDLYGVKEHTSKEDMYLVLHTPDITFRVPIPRSDKLMEEKSIEYKGKTPKIPTTPPQKVKIDLGAKPKKTVKEAATPKAAPVAKPKLTANQKKIAAVKAEIKRLKGLTPNASNLRKIEAQKAELKKLNVKEKLAGTKAAPVPKPKSVKMNFGGPGVQSPARVKETSAPVNPAAETKKIAKKTKVKIQLRDPILDDDDEEIPTGAVRYGGSIIEPEELEFDDDISGIDIPFDESWSANKDKPAK